MRAGLRVGVNENWFWGGGAHVGGPDGTQSRHSEHSVKTGRATADASDEPTLRAALPADEVDDGLVIAAGVGRAGTSSFVRQLQHVICVGEFPAHLPTAHCAAAILYTHGCDTKHADRDCHCWTLLLEPCSLLLLEVDRCFSHSLISKFALGCCLLVTKSTQIPSL